MPRHPCLTAIEMSHAKTYYPTHISLAAIELLEAVYQVRPDYRAVYQFQRTSQRSARARAERNFPGSPIQVAQNPRLRPRKPRSQSTQETERETPCCVTATKRSLTA